uniref:PBPb domain-containing protein n=1 Tax=Rhabditophanes sp. KR3021 TaxID=114890 RepID=A0AC35U147_9BILA
MTHINNPFRVGVFEYEPDAYNCFRNLPTTDCQRPGFEMEVISLTMKILGWNWTLIDVQAKHNISKSFGQRLPNGTFSGLLGLLQSNTIDMSVPTMRITAERHQAALFSHPINFIKQIYITASPTQIDTRDFIFATLTLKEQLLDLLEEGKTWLTYYDETAPVCTLKSNCHKLEEVLKKRPIVVHTSQEKLIQEIKKGAVFYGSFDVDFFMSTINVWSRKHDLIAILDPREINTFSGFAFSLKQKRARDKFNQALSHLLRGLDSIAKSGGGGGYYSMKIPFSARFSRPITPSLSVNTHLKQLFFTYLIGLMVSVLVLIIEIGCGRAYFLHQFALFDSCFLLI